MSKKFRDKSLETSVVKNIEGFMARYPNQKFADYPDYFIDCYEWYCPGGGCDECPFKFRPPMPPLLPPRATLKKGKCPKQEKRVHMRGHIGKLTDEEVKTVGDKALISASLIVLRCATDISHDTPEAESEHSALLERFATISAADRKKLPSQTQLQITIAVSLVKLAEHLRTTRKRAEGYSLTIGSMPGILAEQPSSETTNEDASLGQSKYDDLVEAMVEQSIKDVVAGKAKKLISNEEIVEVLKKSSIFEDGKVPKDSSIKKGIERNSAWKNRKKALAKKRQEEGLGETYVERQKGDKRRGQKKMEAYVDVQ